MSLKVSVKAKEPVRLYPRVMQHVDAPKTIVLFLEPGRGVCIYPESHPDFGKTSNHWVSSGWAACCVTLDSTGE